MSWILGGPTERERELFDNLGMAQGDFNVASGKLQGAQKAYDGYNPELDAEYVAGRFVRSAAKTFGIVVLGLVTTALVNNGIETVFGPGSYSESCACATGLIYIAGLAAAKHPLWPLKLAASLIADSKS